MVDLRVRHPVDHLDRHGAGPAENPRTGGRGGRLRAADLARSLVPIAGQFVRAAAGDVDTAFWRRIYNPADAYGGEVITGWAAGLYPYLRGDGAVDRPNPLLDLPIDQPRDLTFGAMGYTGLAAALDTGGDISHLDTGRLDHLDSRSVAPTTAPDKAVRSKPPPRLRAPARTATAVAATTRS